MDTAGRGEQNLPENGCLLPAFRNTSFCRWRSSVGPCIFGFFLTCHPFREHQPTSSQSHRSALFSTGDHSVGALIGNPVTASFLPSPREEDLALGSWGAPEDTICHGWKDGKHAAMQLHLPAIGEGGSLKGFTDVTNVAILWVLLSISSWLSPSLLMCSQSWSFWNPWSCLLISVASRPVDLIAGSPMMKSGGTVGKPPCFEK